MPRSREEVISEMVDSGLFSDDEIRQAVRSAPQQSSIPGAASSTMMGVQQRPMAHPAEMVKRLAMDTFEGFRPPMNMEETKRFLNPSAAQYGPNRFAQDVIDQATINAGKQAEAFVQQPGVNRFPNAAAVVGTMGAMAPMMMLPSPKGIQQAMGLGKMVQQGVRAEMALRGKGAELGKALISTISPASLDAVKARFENPQAVKGAMTREQLGNSVVSSMKTLSDQIRGLDVNAKNTLSGEQVVSKDELISALAALKQKYLGAAGQPVSAEAKGAIAELDNAINGLRQMNPLPDRAPIEVPTPPKVEFKFGINTKKYQIPPKIEYDAYRGNREIPQPDKVVYEPHVETIKVPQPPEILPGETNRTAGTLSERQIKDVMSQYKNINWDDPAGGAKKEVRKLFDRTLKEKNPEYKAAMEPVAERTKLQSLAEKKLALRYDPTTGTYATDATAGKWTPGLLEGKKPETSQALKRLGALTDNDLLNKARMTNYREQFEGGKTQGSRMVQLGRHVAGVPGAVLGAAMDRMGGNISGHLIDALAAVPTLPSMNQSTRQALELILAEAFRRRKQNAQ